MADNTTQLVFKLAECICTDIQALEEDLSRAEESYRSATESIHAATEAIRKAEESQSNWAASMICVKDKLLGLQESNKVMRESCENWQESIQTNYNNTETLNKDLLKKVRSRQSSCSQTPRLSADIDRRSHAESPFGGLPTTPSQRIVLESSHSLRTESPLSALPNIQKAPKPHSMRMSSDQLPHAELPPSRVSTRSSATKLSSTAKSRLESSNPAVVLQRGASSNDAHVQPLPVQHGKDKQQAGNTATSTPTVESVPGGKDEARASRANSAVNEDDVRGNVCLACLQGWEKYLNENKVTLKEGCVYNPGATDCSECIEKQRKGPHECRKILSGQSTTLRQLKRDYLEVTRNRPKSSQAIKFKEAVTREIQISENTKKKKKKRANAADESQPPAKKSRTSRGRSKSVSATQSQPNKGTEVSLKMEGDTSEPAQ